MSHRSLKVIVRLTDRCNLNCTYCYVPIEARRASTEVLSMDQLDRLYTELLSGRHFQHVQFVWHGGEPTVVGAKYLDAALSAQEKHRGETVVVENSIQTNTTLLSPALIALLKRHNVAIGVSVDAPPESHNRYRRTWNDKPTLPLVLEKIEMLRASGVSFGAICVLHRDNYQRADEIYDFFASQDLSYQLNPFYKDESTSDSAAAQLSITPEQYAEALIRTYDRYIADPQPAIHVAELRDILLSFFTGKSKNCLFMGRCEEFIGIVPSGAIYLCDLFYNESFRIGHVDTISAEGILRSAAVESIARRPERLRQTYCNGCEWWEVCRGGCSSKSAAVYGDAFREDPFCETRKQLFTHIAQTLPNVTGKEVRDDGRIDRDRIGCCSTA